MASVINTNMASLYAQKNLSGAQSALSSSVERLSSGLRINRAKDDVAGLGISEKIKSQVVSLNQGLRNANDAISMVQAAEGSLSEVSSILQRMKELSVQARNDSLSTSQRSFISNELGALKNEINAIAERTTFNDLSLLKNALRTRVAVPAAGDNSALVNGASLLDGISVSNLAVNNTNAGTYTVTTGTQSAIANQVSETSAKFGGAEVDTITIGGTAVATNTVTATIAIAGGATITANITVTAAELKENSDNTGDAVTGDKAPAKHNIARKLAAEINAKAQEATGSALIAARADGAVVSIGAINDSVSMTTSVVHSTGVSATAANPATKIQELAREIFIREDDAIEGNKFTLTVGNQSYSVVAGFASSAALIAKAVADDLRDALLKNYAGVTSATVSDDANTVTSAKVSFVAGNGLGIADISLAVNRLTDGSQVTNQMSSVSAIATSAEVARTLTVNDFDVVEGRKAIVKVGNPDFYTEYSTIVGTGDTAANVAARLNTLLDANFTTTNTAGTNQITFAAADKVGMSVIEISFKEMVESSTNAVAASYVSAKNHVRNDRTITINQSDLTPGNVVAVNIGQKEYAVKVAAGETAANVAYRLSTLIDNEFGGVVVTPSVTGAVATFNVAGMKKGDSISVEGMTFTALRTLTREESAAAFGGMIAANSSVYDALRYGFYSGTKDEATTSTLTTASTVTFAVDATPVMTSRRAVSVGGSDSANVITLGAGLELGLTDISVSVKKITDPGKITITANADTGIGGAKQSIDVGTIAAGSAKSFDFDSLGVSFTLSNSRAAAVNAASFEASTPKVNTLAVTATSGNAVFQVGANTRDDVVLDGFKDVRITGQNKNTGTDKEVFDKVSETMTTISVNTTESLSTANFATLENRIEDAITKVSEFRSYFGSQQNRIEFAIANIQAQSENLTAARSRIVDTDYAAETANLTKTQIMQQAATAMLAQANQMPNVILALLK